MPLPLTRLPGVLPHTEWLVLILYQPSLGLSDKDPGGTPQPPPQVRATRELSLIGETKHPPVIIVEMQTGRLKLSQMRDLTTLLRGKQGLVSDK